jgi:TetR/AcrR family transcriptional repressor of nem operon
MTSKADQKRATHETILASAGRLLRARGIAGARVADVMAGARLTVGGFYGHFASKESLIDAALRRAGAEMRARLYERIDTKPVADRALVVLKRYLSAAHRDDVATGCPLPAVVGEVGTTAPAHGAVMAEEIDAMAGALEAHLAPGGGGSRRQRALALVALMYGGLSLARAARGTALSEEILKACRALGAAALDRDGAA